MSVSVLHPRAQRLEAACCPLPSQLRTALHPHSLAAPTVPGSPRHMHRPPQCARPCGSTQSARSGCRRGRSPASGRSVCNSHRGGAKRSGVRSNRMPHQQAAPGRQVDASCPATQAHRRCPAMLACAPSAHPHLKPVQPAVGVVKAHSLDAHVGAGAVREQLAQRGVRLLLCSGSMNVNVLCDALWAANLGKTGTPLSQASHQSIRCPANQPTQPAQPGLHMPLKLMVSRRPMEMRSLANLRRNSLQMRLCEGAGWSAGRGRRGRWLPGCTSQQPGSCCSRHIDVDIHPQPPPMHPSEKHAALAPASQLPAHSLSIRMTRSAPRANAQCAASRPTAPQDVAGGR